MCWLLVLIVKNIYFQAKSSAGSSPNPEQEYTPYRVVETKDVSQSSKVKKRNATQPIRMREVRCFFSNNYLLSV